MAISNLITIYDPKSPISESYRTLRTNIQFSSTDAEIQTIVVTSSGPGEGKSTTSSNLATVMAQSGKKTLLIDCDQRKPKLHKLFEISNEKGLSDYIVGEAKFDDVINCTEQEDLYLLTSGTRPPNPAELLASSRMKQFISMLKESFDYIILDTPPVMVVTDAQILAQYCDGCVLVVSSAEVDKQAAIKSKELLDKVNAKILGVVLNKLDTNNKGYYGYYYQYYYSNDQDYAKKSKKGLVKNSKTKKKAV